MCSCLCFIWDCLGLLFIIISLLLSIIFSLFDFVTYRVLRRVAVYALFGIGCLPLLAAYNPAIDVDTYLDAQSYSRKTQNVKNLQIIPDPILCL